MCLLTSSNAMTSIHNIYLALQMLNKLQLCSPHIILFWKDKMLKHCITTRGYCSWCYHGVKRSKTRGSAQVDQYLTFFKYWPNWSAGREDPSFIWSAATSHHYSLSTTEFAGVVVTFHYIYTRTQALSWMNAVKNSLSSAECWFCWTVCTCSCDVTDRARSLLTSKSTPVVHDQIYLLQTLAFGDFNLSEYR